MGAGGGRGPLPPEKFFGLKHWGQGGSAEGGLERAASTDDREVLTPHRPRGGNKGIILTRQGPGRDLMAEAGERLSEEMPCDRSGVYGPDDPVAEPKACSNALDACGPAEASTPDLCAGNTH